MSNTMGIASTMSAGVGANHGTMSKPLNMSRVAENGGTATRFALLGMDTMIKLVETHDIHTDNVEKNKVETGANVITSGPLRVAHANNALEAKFCVAFQMAAIVLRCKAGSPEFWDAFGQSPKYQALQPRTTTVPGPEIVALGKGVIAAHHAGHKGWQSYYEQSDPRYRGGPRNPLTYDEVSEKFRDAADGVLSADEMTRFLTFARNFESLPDLAEFLDAVSS